MSAQHCPFCNAREIVAIGAVAYTECVLVEHHCVRCGHLFCISDRRNLSAQLWNSDTDARGETRLARRA